MADLPTAEQKHVLHVHAEATPHYPPAFEVLPGPFVAGVAHLQSLSLKLLVRTVAPQAS